MYLGSMLSWIQPNFWENRHQKKHGEQVEKLHRTATNKPLSI